MTGFQRVTRLRITLLTTNNNNKTTLGRQFAFQFPPFVKTKLTLSFFKTWAVKLNTLHSFTNSCFKVWISNIYFTCMCECVFVAFDERKAGKFFHIPHIHS